MTTTQLSPPIPLDTPKGSALCHFLIDYGPEHHLHWVCFIDATGEIWEFDNTKVRAQKNITMQRRLDDKKIQEPTGFIAIDC